MAKNTVHVTMTMQVQLPNERPKECRPQVQLPNERPKEFRPIRGFNLKNRKPKYPPIKEILDPITLTKEEEERFRTHQLEFETREVIHMLDDGMLPGDIKKYRKFLVLDLDVLVEQRLKQKWKQYEEQ